MTLKEAVRAVHVLTYDQTLVIGKMSDDRMFRKVARWRIYQPEAWREIRDHVFGGPQISVKRGGRNRPRGGTATIVEIRERAARDQGAA